MSPRFRITVTNFRVKILNFPLQLMKKLIFDDQLFLESEMRLYNIIIKWMFCITWRNIDMTSSGIEMWQEFSGWDEHETRHCRNAAFPRKTPSRYCFRKVNTEANLSSWSKRYGSLLIIEVGAVKTEAYANREKRRCGR